MSDSNYRDPHICIAVTSKGKPCSAFAMQDSPYCFSHSPDHAGQRAAARHRGGKTHPSERNRTPFPQTDTGSARGLARFLSDLLQDTWALPPSATRARTLAYLVTIQKEMIEEARYEARREGP